MKDDRLRRVLDRALPSRAREDAMLARLLQEERKEPAVKKLPRRTLAAIAAAALLATCALAAAAGLDGRLLRLFGAAPEEAPLLSAAAVPVDIADTDQGATLRVRQVLADRFAAMLLIEFTPPAGTALDAQRYDMDTRLEGRAADGTRLGSWSSGWELLEAEDGRLTLLYSLHPTEAGFSLLGAALDFTFTGLYEGFAGSRLGGEQAAAGRWRIRLTLPDEDPGRYVPMDRPIEIDGCRAALRSVYVSPLTFAYELAEGPDGLRGAAEAIHGGDRWREDLLHTAAGGEVGLEDYYFLSTSYQTDQQSEARGRYTFRPTRILDPSEITAVTLFGQTFSLDS